MADIYGSQNSVLFQTGLADADDEEDFDIKFQSLESVWERKVTVFLDWFQRNRSQQFKDCLVMSSRRALGIEGRFYTNGLELKHKL